MLGELDTARGVWRWTTRGHPPVLLVRHGKVVERLDQVLGVPLGLGLLDEGVEIAEERLEPGDRLLLYTDGVVEARDAVGQFFGTERLVGFVSRQAADGRPAAETLRRLKWRPSLSESVSAAGRGWSATGCCEDSRARSAAACAADGPDLGVLHRRVLRGVMEITAGQGR